ncbi:nitroreductase family deazaflavin-dependent oxidoreductase [Microbacterium sp. NPDC076911]|uniref:nitroreductase family deazaflavin-dependent oxidoreductase n=1 Tax=Microbacterium sp. NPDC076911 TaxID=3154958 RepID=UPI003439C9A1
MTERNYAAEYAERMLRTRWLMRAPILLYRARLGWMLGERFVMIEHQGRKSGLPRYVVVEVTDRERNVVRVGSGFGKRADWYRNMAANGVAYLSTGRVRRVPAHVRMLDEAESAAVLKKYAARHPESWDMLEPVMKELSGEPVSPVVEFTPPAGWSPRSQARS